MSAAEIELARVSGDPIFKRVFSFVAGECARKEHRTAVRFELLCAAAGAKGDSVRTWEREEYPHLFEPANVQALAMEMIQAAQAYADGMGPGSIRFKIVSTGHLGQIQREMFRLTANAHADDPSSGEDEPTPGGALAQSLRHSEFMMQIMGRMFQSTIGTLSRRLDNTEAHVERLIDQRMKSFDELEEARSKQSDRDLEGMKQIAADQRKEKIVDKMLPLIPAVANRIVSRIGGGSGGGDDKAAPVIPGAVDPRDVMINDLASSLDREQVMKIASALRPEQQILLMELFESAKKKTATDAPAPGGVNGHAQPAQEG